MLLKEFFCRCCGNSEVHPALVSFAVLLEKRIGEFNFSACRCLEHNRKEGGSPTSSHLPTASAFGCCALDIPCTDGAYRWSVVFVARDMGIRRIVLANDHIHLDINPNKPASVLNLE